MASRAHTPLPAARRALDRLRRSLWLFVAAFPFLWTAWGSFKVEARLLLPRPTG